VLFLVPGLAFDARGARLGRGAGSYDRALARHVNALRIGLAYEFQLVQRLPEAAWDIRMDAVATDARLVDCAVRRRG
jgi:5-formyltetrahydrofolate cyclo-ligase